MARPEDRPLRRLPRLDERKATLERCVFCPKLCRSACPVSDADPRETLTPWGKMSMAYFAAAGSVPLEEPYARPAWACTGCFGCREHCDHKNDVAGTLFEARSELVAAGVAPATARGALERFAERSAALGETARDERVRPWVDGSARTAVLVGCEHARRATEGGRDLVRATAALTGGKVDIVEICCGAPLLYAGDRERFTAQSAAFASAVREKDVVVTGDAGCASALRLHAAEPQTKVLHLAELAARHVERLGELDLGEARWHDPCQLGRGLGVYEPPRAVLSRVLGRAPAEFERSRSDARCSGAGGLLPVTMPEVAKTIADARIADHERSGGGTIVTGCASSLRAFQKRGADAIDLATVIARALDAGRK